MAYSTTGGSYVPELVDVSIPQVQITKDLINGYNLEVANIVKFSIYVQGIIVNKNQTVVKQTEFIICGAEFIKVETAGPLEKVLWVGDKALLE